MTFHYHFIYLNLITMCCNISSVTNYDHNCNITFHINNFSERNPGKRLTFHNDDEYNWHPINPCLQYLHQNFPSPSCWLLGICLWGLLVTIMLKNTDTTETLSRAKLRQLLYHYYYYVHIHQINEENTTTNTLRSFNALNIATQCTMEKKHQTG